MQRSNIYLLSQAIFFVPQEFQIFATGVFLKMHLKKKKKKGKNTFERMASFCVLPAFTMQDTSAKQLLYIMVKFKWHIAMKLCSKATDLREEG